MGRMFRDHKGDIHFIQEGQDPKPEWEELPAITGPPLPVELPYTLKRAREYPTVAEQLDMLWDTMDADLMPGKDGPWYQAIKAIKDKYPKPS